MRRVLALITAVFGLATVAAGVSVLTGADPGYAVFKPLLWFNTAMGTVYIAASVTMWRSVSQGRRAAGAITLLNLLVLAAVGIRFATAGTVAIESVRAMTFRTGVWLLLTFGLAWIGKRDANQPPTP